jgi:hypothetical protein
MFGRGRGFELMVGGVTLGVVLWSASTACKFTPTAPGPGCGLGANPITCINITIGTTGDGPYSATLHGTYTTTTGTLDRNSNTLYFGLQPGIYTVDGTMSTANLTFYIIGGSASVPGGVQTGSVQSTKGPFVATPSLCHVSYAATGSSPPPQQFSFTFTVGTTGPFCP